MPAYIIANMDVKDPETYQGYSAQTPGLVEKFGGKFIVRGGEFEQVEGDWKLARLVVLEFPDLSKAKAFYNSPEYQEALKIRQSAAESQVVIVDGV
ncbi:MAG: DUF1330 domain-containing protein [SAR324 cluster bacterium]|nr:DUF1330 domain-containing protein [SAR324 cluster bacterium]MCZ6532703.1 DUF1330 domain-containing protein [SAR324 cluster bacterium]MCZ6559055.1 DUF1330 domain-containing protein [SAR324 cluster bacterium]MCZ6629650.1 DUF1330 domain-containing protein [SAR324 cluster bacterium]MCZ6647313.1 DUF1330 domain-containing protein [SAR324 cluster bacterium]